MTTVMLLAIVGNIFLIFIIFRGNAVVKRRISPVQLLLLHTCAADLLFALLSLGTEIIIILRHPVFDGPAWLCQLIRYLQMFPMYTSSFLLVAISFDRFQAICRPLQTYCSDRYRRPNYFAIIAWITALICSTPQLFIWHKTKYGECATIYGHGVSLLKSIYVISFNTIAWLIPSMLAAFFYYRVCKTIWLSYRNQQLLLQMSDSSPINNSYKKNPSQETRSYVVRLHNDSRHCRRQLMKFNRDRFQTICLTMTIIFCNFFLWAPFCVVNVLQAVVPHLLSSQLITYIVILGNLNSCVNPWIYIIFNRNQVKKAFTFTNDINGMK
ncbi:Uncharacterized protein BM_BM3372 [Brugia malayi]|uniref:G_PROTEIN_RECEP_F1_2 domain-containing protein n=2 Tax=Brugia malayi TaxID=6279 RepID=A0A4E9EWI5_BRUMA|nr:Uncharacterized protein BM_BM3372 [Brugia malayi]VIO88618.1 Uncharacterized protein BM_BM3372 [Brugia malayi]